MAAEEQEQDSKGSDEPEAKTPDIKELVSQLDAIKQAQSGSDKKVAELSRALTQAQKEKDELLKQSMSDKQRSDFEREQREKALAAKEAELHAKDIALIKAEVVMALGVPKNLVQFINGETREEVEARAKSLIEEVKQAATADVNKRLVTESPKPSAGDEPRGAIDRAKLDDIAVWQKVWNMPAGPEKEKALAALFDAAQKL